MKILITGAGGFIGSHMVERCVMQGYDTRAFVRYKSNNQWGWLENSKYIHDFEIITGDIRDYDSVRKAISGCNAVIHMAALIGIPYSYISPLAYVKTNIEGTYNVLEASREHSLRNVIITSTSETYGSAQYVPIDEKHSYVGQSPYSATKIAADQLAKSYHKSFHVPVTIARPFNTYGPRQSARAVIPAVVSQILKGDGEIKLGNVTPTRDLTFVEDTVNAFIEILKNDSLRGEAVNIGNNEEISIGNLAELIAHIMKKEISVVTDENRVRTNASEVDRLRCDNTKIMENTSWKPRVSLNEGLERTIQWIEAHLDTYKPEMYNV